MNLNQVACRVRFSCVVLSYAILLLGSFYVGLTHDRVVLREPSENVQVTLGVPRATSGSVPTSAADPKATLGIPRAVPGIPRSVNADLVSQLIEDSNHGSFETDEAPWDADLMSYPEVGDEIGLLDSVPWDSDSSLEQSKGSDAKEDSSLPSHQSRAFDSTPAGTEQHTRRTDDQHQMAAQVDEFSPLESFDYGIGSESETIVLSSGDVLNLHVKDSGLIQPRILRIKVADPSICEAVISSATKMQLIAIGEGQTHIDAWISLRPGGKDPTQRKYRIEVMSLSERLKSQFGNRLGVLQRSIRKVYPKSNVSIRVESKGLVVSGTAETSEDADGILRMIRKVVLLPVKDELVAKRSTNMAPMVIPSHSGDQYYFDEQCPCQDLSAMPAESPLPVTENSKHSGF